MKKNTLYTVNPWNRNLFYNGGLSSAVNSAINWKPGNTYTVQPQNYVSGIDFSTNYGNTGQRFNAIVNSGNNGLGNWKNAGINTNGANGGGNQDSKGLSSGAQAAIGLGAEALGSIPTGDKRGMWDTLDPVYHLADGRESKVGNAFSDTGVMLTKTGLSTGNYYLALAGAAAKIVGGLANAGWGYKIENEGAVKDNINNLKNVRFGGDFDDIQSQAARTSINGMGLGKVSDGWFNSKGTRKAKELIAQQENALAFANNSLDNAIYNAQQDQTNNLLRNYAAFGGYIGIPTGIQTGALGIMQQDKYIDAINNRSNAIAKAGTILPASSYATLTTNKFDAGGFVDNFMQDPVAAAMNYIKQRDAEEAQAEAQAAQEAREQAFADMQTRLMNAETQNQGLQALLEDQNRSIAALQEAQALQDAAVSPTPSSAVQEPVGNNNTWDYIEGQLRRSGKFNDVQIEGIKYNLQRESALNPYAVGDNGEAFGLGQWHGSRQPKDRSLAGQTQHLIDTLSNYDGASHWMGRSNYEGFLNARTPEEAHYWIARGYERPRADILAKVKRDSDMSLRNLRAFGGEKNGLISPVDNTYVNKQQYIPIIESPFTFRPYDKYFKDGIFTDKNAKPFRYIDKGGTTTEFDSIPLSDKEAKNFLEKRRRMNRTDRIREALRNTSLHAFGGELGTNGTDFTNGLLQVNAGNTHERNPFGGVPMGLDPQGIPNLVEEGETVFNDYVFSKRLKVPNFMLRDLGLGGAIHKGKRYRMSFADVSKKLAEESEMRPNDPISMNGLQASLAKLMEVQEAERMKEQAKLQSEEIDTASDDLALMAACGGKLHKYGLGGNIFDGRRRYNRMQRSSNVDTRSDTTRRGRHEGTLKGMQSSLIPLEDIWNAIDAETNFTNPDNPYYNPYLQTGVAPIAGRAGGYRTGSYNYNRARQAYSASRQAARNQAPSAVRNTRSAATTANTGRDYVQEANNTVNSRNLRTGQQWAENAGSTPTVTQTRIQGNVKEGNHYASDFKGRTTQTSALNSKDATGRRAASRGDAVDPYAGLEGTLDFGSQRMRGWGWPIAIGAGLGTAGVGSYLYDESIEEAQEENPYLPQKTKSASGKKTVWYIPGHRNAGTFKSEKEAQEYYNKNLRGKQSPQQAQAAPASSSTPSTAASNMNTPKRAARRNAAPATTRAAQNNPQGNSPQESAPIEWALNPGIAGLRSEEIPVPGNGQTTLPQAGASTSTASDIESLRGLGTTAAAQTTGGNTSQAIPTYDTRLRYAPVVGAGLMSLTDVLGLTNRPDYTYADRLEAAANRAGYAPNIQAPVIGDYMRYSPFDRLFYANQLQANARATDRALMNTSGGNRGTAQAAMLANGYNTNNNLGNLYRQAEEYNRDQYERTKEFNRRTNMFNAQMGLEADMANARYRQQASQMGLSGLAQAAAMRNDIDARTSATRSANLSNLFTSLGNIGRENMAFNMINSTNAARNGYWIDNEGVVHYVGKKDGLG